MADRLDKPQIRDSQQDVQRELVGRNGLGAQNLNDIRQLNQQQGGSDGKSGALDGFPDAGSLLKDLDKDQSQAKDGTSENGSKPGDSGDKAQPNSDRNSSPQQAPQTDSNAPANPTRGGGA